MTIEFQSKDWERIELYMKAGATQQKIADAFRIHPQTLSTKVSQRYNEPYEQVVAGFRSLGEILIEATQFQKALAGNVPMLLWLGKIRCGQREPDIASTKPPLEEQYDKDHLIMKLQHKIDQMTELLSKYGYKPEAE